MPRLDAIPTERASGATKELYGAIQSALGGVPNIFQGIANSPAALGAYLSAGENLKKGSLSFAERETVALTVSRFNDCRYCLAAHTALGKMAGHSPENVLQIRQGQPADPKTKALVAFTRAVLEKTGNVSTDDIRQVKTAGYGDGAITEILLVIGLTVFTNLFNHVNQTVLDFPETA